MHADKKVGLAVGILAVGVIGALFFRIDRDPFGNVPEIFDPQRLDRRIAQESIAPYVSDEHADETDESGPEVPEWLLSDSSRSRTPPDPIPVADEEASLSGGRSQESNPDSTPPSVSGQVVYEEYEVRSGDTLSGLAARFLGDSGRFMELYRLNDDRLDSPDDLRPRQRLRISAQHDGNTRPRTVDREQDGAVSSFSADRVSTDTSLLDALDSDDPLRFERHPPIAPVVPSRYGVRISDVPTAPVIR